MGNFIRTKTYYCGGSGNEKATYMEQDLFPMYENKKNKKSRNGKSNMTTPKQQNLNDSYSKRYCFLKALTNFHQGDFFVTLTYAEKFHPASYEDAKKDMQNYLRRVKALAKKRNGIIEYIYVTEEGALHGRIHFHLLINSDCGLTRDELEALWHKPFKKDIDKAEMVMGVCNVKVVQNVEGGVEAIVKYMLKYTRNVKGRRTWNCSKNLKAPQISTNDGKTSRTKFEQLCLMSPDAEEVKEHFEKANPGYDFIGLEKVFNENNTSFTLRAKLRLKREFRRKLSTGKRKKGDNYARANKRSKKKNNAMV